LGRGCARKGEKKKRKKSKDQSVTVMVRMVRQVFGSAVLRVVCGWPLGQGSSGGAFWWLRGELWRKRRGTGVGGGEMKVVGLLSKKEGSKG